ncbi:LGFP repeat-containing protein [Paractinoplanes hotanensis]|uniref:LGFP repeat-containing protein n=1 Tax=Paractinoplanes hotanensis TaxID=2906497 RepID=A0ABT0YFA9_9ACTN|nr:hypothetical protein [Actinoplanes hotanensis]MCM4084728.1 hypothetical protein [Actinoplanes hotanensis]
MDPEPRRIETSVDGSSGVQIGTGNIQNNNYVAPEPLDLSFVEWSSPRAAADKILGMPARNAFRVLAEAAVDKTAAVLRVLLASDDSLVVELLADVHPGRVQALVDAGGAELEVLRDVPRADEEISELHGHHRAVLGGKHGGLRRSAASPRGNTGFYRLYENGAIFWSASAGAVSLLGPFLRFHRDEGGTGGRLGFPIGESEGVTGTGVATKALRQRLEPDKHSRATSVYSTVEYGVFATRGGIGKHYDLRGGPDRFGFPTGPGVEAGPTRSGGTGDSGWIQPFEKGSIAYTNSTGAIEIMSPVREHHDAHGGVSGRLGFPRGKAQGAGRSPRGTDGKFQRFEGAWDYPEDLVAACIGFDRPGGATVYTSVHGTYKVDGGIGILYERMGGTAGWLGFPTGSSEKAEERRRVQAFEGGDIYWSPEHDAVAVRADVLALVRFVPPTGFRFDPDERVGFPTHPEQSIGSGPDTIQFFEHAVVTRRSNDLTVWHPRSEAQPPAPSTGRTY